jgi:hypothetical protein
VHIFVRIMKKWLIYPSRKQIHERLNKRFRAPDARTIQQAQTQLQEAAALDWTKDEQRETALREIKAVASVMETGQPDARVSYLRTITDLQVGKVSGLLAYCAIIAAFAASLYDKVVKSNELAELAELAACGCVASALLCVIASLATLAVIWSSTPGDTEFDTSSAESAWLEGLLWRRGFRSNLAVVLAAGSTLILVASLIIVFPWHGVRTKALPEGSPQGADQPVSDAPIGATSALQRERPACGGIIQSFLTL